jgi:transposase
MMGSSLALLFKLPGSGCLTHVGREGRADRSNGKTGLTTEERGELVKLRREVRELRLQRDILKKAAAFFARESE